MVNIERYDENGYPHGKLNHSDLLHRQIAFNQIYLKDREKYPIPFSKYVVHHKDRNKENFNPENLQLLSREEHERLHNMPSKNQSLKQYYARKEREWKIEQDAIKERERYLIEKKKEGEERIRMEEMREQNKKEFDLKKVKKKWFFINFWRRKKERGE